jgi:molybdenum cofactor synthesis domain-containing protein
LQGIPTAILIASDRCAAGTREDRTGPSLKQAIEQEGGRIVWQGMAADEIDLIERKLREACREASLVLAAGGTGLGPRDVTPEATRRVIEREVPGMAEILRLHPFPQIPRAILSRAAAGTFGKSLIVNLPGNPEGAVSSLRLLIPVLSHAVDLLSGKTAH